jgi:hypothetical protein
MSIASTGLTRDERGGRLQSAPVLDPITVTITEASRLSGFGVRKLAEFIKDGRVKSVKIDHKRLIIYASLKALLIGEPPAADAEEEASG